MTGTAKPNALIELSIALIIPAFNQGLGQLTRLRYPVIGLPSTLPMMAVFCYLTRTIGQPAGPKRTDAIKH